MTTYLLKNKDCYITSYQVKEGCKIIRSNAFFHNTYLTDVTLPETILYIGNGAFSSCHELSKISLPEKLVFIGDGTFSNCYCLPELILPNNLTHIGIGAFKSAKTKGIISNSRNFTFSDGCLVDVKAKKLIAFLSDSNSVQVPAGITHIGEGVFDDCRKLISVILPDSIINIEDCAFLLLC